MDNAQPIVVKKINKGGHGHHGGAWKVAFADFVTAMMAFFLLMWLMASTTPQEKAAISDFFQNPSAVQGPGGASTSMIKLGGVGEELKKQDKDKDKGESSDTKKEKSEGKSSTTTEVEKEIEIQKDAERLENLKQDMEKAIAASQAMKPFKDQLLLDITSEGLRIQIIDKEGRPMFDAGSSHLKAYTKIILKEIAVLIGKVPNRISLTGHTDASRYTSHLGYSNWELSTDRANASRRELVFGGLKSHKVAKVVGLSSTVLFDKKNPLNPVNRRISLIVMNKATEEALMRDGAIEVKDVGDAEDVLNKRSIFSSAPAGQKTGSGKPVPKLLTPKRLVPKTPGSGSPSSRSISPESLAPKRAGPQVLGQKSVKSVKKKAARSEDKEKPEANKPPARKPENGAAITRKTNHITPIIPIKPINPISPIKLP